MEQTYCGAHCPHAVFKTGRPCVCNARVEGRGPVRRYGVLCNPSEPDYDPQYVGVVLADGTGNDESWRNRPEAAAYPPAAPKKYPSLLEQAANAASAAVAFVASGFKVADQAEVERRLAICHECDQFDAEQARCRSCGCFTNLKSRAETLDCPLGRW